MKDSIIPGLPASFHPIMEMDLAMSRTVAISGMRQKLPVSKFHCRMLVVKNEPALGG